MKYRVADVADIKQMLPSDIDKAAYNPDQVELVFMVDEITDQIRYGRAVDMHRSAFQMFNILNLGTWAELIPVGPWKPIEKEDTTGGR